MKTFSDTVFKKRVLCLSSFLFRVLVGQVLVLVLVLVALILVLVLILAGLVLVLVLVLVVLILILVLVLVGPVLVNITANTTTRQYVPLSTVLVSLD